MEPNKLPPAATSGEYRILFVCLGNICRSPSAEAILDNIIRKHTTEDQPVSIQVDSAGIGGGHSGERADERMRAHAERRGISITHRARQVQIKDFYDFDLLVAMDDSNYDDLCDRCPEIALEGKIHRMASFLTSYPWDHIPDPYYGGAEGFELVLDLLYEGCLELYHMIQATAH